MAESLPYHYVGSGGIIPESQPPLHPRSLLRNMMDLSMYLLRFTKLLSPEAVAALKKHNSEAINEIAKKRSIHVTDITGHELFTAENTIPEEQPDLHQNDHSPESEIDPILDYINSQHHQEEDMNYTLQTYNIMTSPFPDDTHQWSINSVHTNLFIILLKQNKLNLVHLLIGVPMVVLQYLM